MHQEGGGRVAVQDQESTRPQVLVGSQGQAQWEIAEEEEEMGACEATAALIV